MRCLKLMSFFMLVATGAARADVLVDWVDLAVSSLQSTKQTPAEQARTMAILQLAMFEAINGSDGPYTSYLPGSNAGISVASASIAPGAGGDRSREVRAAAAAHEALTGLLPAQKAAFDAALEKSLAASAGGAGRDSDVAEGRRIGAAVLALRANDGWDAPNTFRPPTRPGLYIPTSLPISSSWGSVKPWAMKSGSEFRPGKPPELSSKTWARDYNEIKAIGRKTGSTRTEAQTETAKFWTVAGPGGRMPIVHQLASRGDRSLVQRARLYALVGFALSDAYVAVMDAKYAYSFWRPVTAIRNGDQDGNEATERDPAWEPLVDTPMHPEYPCSHCIGSAALAGVLESELGTGSLGAFSMTSAAAPGAIHTWEKLSDHAAEVSNARIWGGIHYRNSTEVGAAMGRSIAKAVVSRVLLPR